MIGLSSFHRIPRPSLPGPDFSSMNHSMEKENKSSELQSVDLTNDTAKSVHETNVTQIVGVKRKRDCNSEEDDHGNNSNHDSPHRHRPPVNPFDKDTPSEEQTRKKRKQATPHPSRGPDDMHSFNDQVLSIVNDCVNALLYQDGVHRYPHTGLLKQIKDVKEQVGKANALFLEGLRQFVYDSLTPFEHLAEAEEKGCNHPVMYYFLGECYSKGTRGIAKDATKAFEYYTKALGGMSIYTKALDIAHM